MQVEHPVRAIVGLGNPGPRFDFTRHNIGFMVLDALAQDHHVSWESAPLLEYATIRVNEQPVLLIKPQTFMNDSGKILPFLKRKGIDIEEVLVVHDELEFPFGKVTMRIGGSARGHNGLRSFISLGSPDFKRIRVGIGRPEDRAEVGDYVLARFSESPEEIDQVINKSLDLIAEQLPSQPTQV